MRVTVRDHGKGIPDYAQDKVFHKFYSLARPHSQKKSTGLGPGVREGDRDAASRAHRSGECEGWGGVGDAELCR